MKRVYLILAVVMLFVVGCKDDKLVYEVPTTYDFENVSYQGQLDRLGMLSEMKTYLNTLTSGASLDINRLNAMYANSDGADWTATYGSKQMRNKTEEVQQLIFDQLLVNAANDSGTTEAASDGTAGNLVSLDGEKTYFVNANGVEYVQIIEKGLMGAMIMHQQTTVYLGADRMDVDNTTVERGEGTAMEHHWDESFGYYGVPVDFPTNTDGVKFWGDYCNDRDGLLGTNTTVMGAYLEGRAAISNDDLDTRDDQISIIQSVMDEVAAASAVHYINSTISNYNDPARRMHALSEAVAFIYATKFNPASLTSSADLNSILSNLGNSANLLELDFWDINISDLETAKATIVNLYGWDSSIADQF